MRIVFFATSEFAVEPLEALLKSRHELVCVVTQHQRQKGRGLKVSPQAVEECADRHGLKILKFDNVNSEEALDSLKKEDAHIFVVVSFGQILKREVLDIPEFYSVNIHASLLPKYRGAAPIQRAIINGDKKTGVTIIRMNESLDKGDIVAWEDIDIGEDDDSLSLSQRLSRLGAVLITKTLDNIDSGWVKFKPQPESGSCYAPKLKKEDGLIDWGKDAVSIKNLVRGCYPWPSAYTYIDGRLLKILKVDISEAKPSAAPGGIIKTDNNGILVACREGAISIKRLQMEGKKPLESADFLRGFKIKKDTIFKR